MFQEIVVFIVVAVAAAYLVRMAARTFLSRRACGGCGSACGGKVTQKAPQLVQLQINLKDKPPR